MPVHDYGVNPMSIAESVWRNWANRIANELGYYGACPNCGGRPMYGMISGEILCDRGCGYVYATEEEQGMKEMPQQQLRRSLNLHIEKYRQAKLK